MKEQDQTIRSLPDGRRRITEAYRLFKAFIQQIKTLQSLRLGKTAIESLASNPVEDDFENQAKQSKLIRENARINFAGAFKRLRDLHGRLAEAFAPVLPMLKNSLQPLGKFNFAGLKGNHAFWFSDQIFARTEEWASLVENLLSLDLEIPIDPFIRERLTKIEGSLPLLLASEEALLDRLSQEESQLLRDLPDYAKISGLKERDSKTLPEIVEAIERAYDLAFSLVSRLRFAESFATQAAELTAIAFLEGEDEERRIAESLAQAKGKLFDRRSDLQDLCSLIDSDLEELREAFEGTVIEVFGFSFAELGDFDEAEDRSAYAVVTKLSYAVRRWIRETIGFLSMAEQFPVTLDLSLRQQCNDLADGFPVSKQLERAIRKRLLLEKSILTRNAKAYAETKGIIGTTTTLTGRKKSEKTREQIRREKSFLDLLSEYEKWQSKQSKRSGPVDWLQDRSRWSSKSKLFLSRLCGEKDKPGEVVILRDAIRYAQKLRRKQSSGD